MGRLGLGEGVMVTFAVGVGESEVVVGVGVLEGTGVEVGAVVVGVIVGVELGTGLEVVVGVSVCARIIIGFIK